LLFTPATAFQDIFPLERKLNKRRMMMTAASKEEIPPLSNDEHISDWILEVIFQIGFWKCCLSYSGTSG
jgi:hypothetical protein